MNYNKRIFISFDGKCPLKCKYCYTYDLEDGLDNRTGEELVESIAEKEFDIIYLSQTYENFYDQENGLCLCEALYSRYKKDIFIITKARLSDATISRLSELNNRMKENGNQLYLGISLCAWDSYYRVEEEGICASPEERMCNLKEAFSKGIKTLLLLRPVFPDNIIPVSECTNILERVKPFIYAVISSGLIITPKNSISLNIQEQYLNFMENGDSDYLANLEKEKIKFVNVEKEIEALKQYCVKSSISFFRHSMPALNYIK